MQSRENVRSRFSSITRRSHRSSAFPHLRRLAHSLDAQYALQPRPGLHRRRRLLARDIALLASSLDFLHSTSEKINLNRLVR
jgi:hypothetical protein